MREYQIISDSSCDLPESLLKEHNIDLVPYYFTLDGNNYFREGVDMGAKEFYAGIAVKGVFPKTSLPPIQDYIDIFRPHLEKGLDIICICLTAKFSGSVQSAYNAKNILLEDFPDCRIEIVDSVNVTATQGMLLLEAVKMKKAGFTLNQVLEKIEEVKSDSLIVFTVDTLEYLQRGGRIGKAAALAGSLFNIKPVILFEQGELIPHSKVRGRKKALHEVLDIFEKRMDHDKNLYSYALLSSDCDEEAREFAKDFEARGYRADLPRLDIGVTITVHTGPQTIGVAKFRKFETL